MNYIPLLHRYIDNISNQLPLSLTLCGIYTRIMNYIPLFHRYIDNISNNPDDQKYRCIRVNNKTLQEKVISLQGAEEYMQSIGFVVGYLYK